MEYKDHKESVYKWIFNIVLLFFACLFLLQNLSIIDVNIEEFYKKSIEDILHIDKIIDVVAAIFVIFFNKWTILGEDIVALTSTIALIWQNSLKIIVKIFQVSAASICLILFGYILFHNKELPAPEIQEEQGVAEQRQRDLEAQAAAKKAAADQKVIEQNEVIQRRKAAPLPDSSNSDCFIFNGAEKCD